MVNGAAGEIFGGKWPDSKIFVKWQPRKCSKNGVAGEFFNNSKKKRTVEQYLYQNET
jgi:hypothetical protein